MNIHRRLLSIQYASAKIGRGLCALFALAALLAGCSAIAPPSTAPLTAPAVAPELTAAARESLAPGGVLRVGVYPGSPTSLIVEAKTGERAGIAHDLGKQLARDLGVRFELVEFQRVAEVIQALKASRVDFTFTNATVTRAKDIDFTLPMLSLELGYLVSASSSVTALTDIDQRGVRVGVSEGSSSQASLSQQYRNATVVPVASLKRAREMLAAGELEAFATNKAVLHELLDLTPGSRLLSGRWGEEHMAIAIPKGRAGALAYLGAYAKRAKSDGSFKAIVKRSGLRGSTNDD